MKISLATLALINAYKIAVADADAAAEKARVATIRARECADRAARAAARVDDSVSADKAKTTHN
jgi:hypothetical protein